MPTKNSLQKYHQVRPTFSLKGENIGAFRTAEEKGPMIRVSVC